MFNSEEITSLNSYPIVRSCFTVVDLSATFYITCSHLKQHRECLLLFYQYYTITVKTDSLYLHRDAGNRWLSVYGFTENNFNN